MKDLLCKKNIRFLSVEDLENFKKENKGQVVYNIIRKYIIDEECDIRVISVSDLNKALEIFEKEFENETRELLEDASYTEEEIEEFKEEDSYYIFGDTYGYIELNDNRITMYITANKVY